MAVQAEQAKQVAIEKALAEGRARAQEHRENRDIFMEEIRASATEWGKQYMVLLQVWFGPLCFGRAGVFRSEASSTLSSCRCVSGHCVSVAQVCFGHAGVFRPRRCVSAMRI